MIDEELKNAVMTDIILLSLVGIHVVLIHGGGPEINDMLKKIGKEPKFVNGLRLSLIHILNAENNYSLTSVCVISPT